MSTDPASLWQQVRALQTALFNGVQPQKLLAEALRLFVEQTQARIGTLLHVQRWNDGQYLLETLCHHPHNRSGLGQPTLPRLLLESDRHPALHQLLLREQLEQWSTPEQLDPLLLQLSGTDCCDLLTTFALHHRGQPIALLLLVDPARALQSADDSAVELLRLVLLQLLLEFSRQQRQQRDRQLTEGCTGALTALAQQRPIEEILTLLADTLVRLFPDRGCLFMRLNREQGWLEPIAWSGLSAAHVAAVHGFPVDAEAICCGLAAWRSEEVMVDSLEEVLTDAPLRGVIIGSGFQTCWSRPLLDAAQQVAGTLAIYARVPLHLSANDRQMIDRITQVAALTLAHWKTLMLLRERDQMLDGAFDNALLPMALCDTQANFLQVNDAFCDWLGYPREQLLQMGIFDIVFPETIDSSRAVLERAITRGSFRLDERRYRHRDGSPRHAAVNISVVVDQAGAFSTAIVQFFDMTERKQSLDALQQREAELLASQRLARLGSWRLEVTTGHLSYNQEAMEILGSDPQVTEALATLSGFQQLVHPADRSRLAEAIETTLRDLQPYQIEYRFLLPEGRLLWVDSTGEVELAADGQLIAVSGVFQDVTERKRVEESLRASEARFRGTFESAVHGMAITSPIGHFIQVNQSLARILGRAPEALIGRPVADFTPPQDLERDREIIRQFSSAKLRQLTFDKRYLRPDGHLVWATLSVAGVYDQNGALQHFITHTLDVTERKQAEAALDEERERLFVTLNSIGDAVITTDAEGHVTFLNPVAEQLTGWYNTEVLGRPLEQVFHIISEDHRQPVESPVQRVLLEGRIVGLANHTLLINRLGQEIAIEDSAAPIRNLAGDIIGVVLVFHDVSQARQMAVEMSWQATHDALTGLVNRREFEHRLSEAIKRCWQEQVTHIFLYLDLDQFKLVNDTCGHLAGDELLRQLTHLLHGRIRDIDTLSRLGGDEFGVLLEHCSLEKGLEIADTLRTLVREFRFVWEEKIFEVGVSIGLVVIDEQIESADKALSLADLACYAAKDLGRNRVHVYQADDDDLARRHGEMQWATRINWALAENRFTLYRQEIRPVRDDRHEPPHFELLIRMLGEQDELILPSQFIPAAERYNLMPKIDRWVIEHCFRYLSRHHDGQTRFTINLSGMSLGEEATLDFIREQIRHYRIDPLCLCFEITETAAIANLVKASRLISTLKSLGCRFALDDFGSGLSSFAYLKNLPIDYLKIDGSFVKDMVDDPIDRAMVSAIHQIGQAMGIRTVAEFVENGAILEQLRAIGLDYAQGYAIAWPEPLPNF